MFGNSIKARVNRVIKHRIKVAQKTHDERVKAIEAEHEEAKKNLEAAKDNAVEASAVTLVESIIGKIS